MEGKQQSLFNRMNARYTLKQRTLDDLLTVLRNLGCTYYIKDSEGGEFKHGDILSVRMAKPVPNKRKLDYPKGELTGYLRPFVEALKPGENVVIPGGSYGAEKLQSSVTSLCSRTFGNGSCMSTMNKKDNTIEILRLL